MVLKKTTKDVQLQKVNFAGKKDGGSKAVRKD